MFRYKHFKTCLGLSCQKRFFSVEKTKLPTWIRLFVKKLYPDLQHKKHSQVVVMNCQGCVSYFLLSCHIRL